MVTLNDDFKLVLPMLGSFDEIPFGTSVLWGITDNLRRCTALTLPFGPPGTITSSSETQSEHLFSASGLIRQLVVGRRHVSDPASKFVSAISFTPQPNKDLHRQQIFQLIQPNKDISELKFSPTCEMDRTFFGSAHIAYFAREPHNFFETLIQPIAATVSASISGNIASPPKSEDRSHISFSLRFDTPHSLEDALEEALKFSAFLSFIAHQYVYPAGFHLNVVGDDTPYELHCRDFHPATERPAHLGRAHAGFAGRTTDTILRGATKSERRRVLARLHRYIPLARSGPSTNPRTNGDFRYKAASASSASSAWPSLHRNACVLQSRSLSHDFAA